MLFDTLYPEKEINKIVGDGYTDASLSTLKLSYDKTFVYHLRCNFGKNKITMIEKYLFR